MSIGRRGAESLVKMVGGHMVVVAVVTLTGVVVPRLLGTTSYGIFAAVVAVIAILHAVAPAGLHMVEVRFLAPLWQQGEREQATRLASSIWTIRLGLAVLLGGAAWLWLRSTPGLALGPWIPALGGLLCALRCALTANRSLFLPLGHAGKTVTFEAIRAALWLALVVLCFEPAGLTGVFTALPLASILLLVASIVLLRRIIPVRLSLSSLPALRPHLGFSLSTLIANLATTAHTHLAVWAVASLVVPEQAAFLAVAVHPFTLGSGLYYAARRALMPQLAELETAEDEARLVAWGELMLRYGAAAAAGLTVAWAALGRDLVRLALTATYLPVVAPATAMLVCLALFCCGATCNGLLYIRRRAGAGSVNHILYACLNLAGLVAAVSGPPQGTAARITLAYAASAGLYAVSAWLTLGLRGGLWLPVGRSLALLMPMLAAWPLTTWSAGPGPRALVLVGCVVLWITAVLGLGLLPRTELARLVRMVRATGARPRHSVEAG